MTPSSTALAPSWRGRPPRGKWSSSAAGTAESSRIAAKAAWRVRLLSAAAQERDDLCFAAPRHPCRDIA